MKVPTLALVLMLTASQTLADIRVVPLYHRADTDIIQQMQPFLDPGERVAGNGQQLVIQAGSARIDELQQLISSLDTPQRALLITLDDSGSLISHERGVDIQGRVGGRHGEVVIGEQGGQGNRAQIRHYSSQQNNSGLRTLQTLEGSAAFINTGQQVPQRQWSHDHRGRPVVQTVQRQLNQGFYVTPHVQGDRVILEVDTRNDRFSSQDRHTIEQRNLSTRVSGRLGEWITLGELDDSSQLNGSGITGYGKAYSTENNTIRIKVQLLSE